MILPYSRCGRTMEVYNSGKVVSSNAVNECLINTKTLFACFTGDDACVWNFNQLDPFLFLRDVMDVHSYNKVVDCYLSQYAYFSHVDW